MVFLQRAYARIMLLLLAGVAAVVLSTEARSSGPFLFQAIEGGQITLDDWRGQPVLVVNTASRCGYTPQYAQLQDLQDRYADRGLVVLAVPSNDFRQELGSNADVAEFCEVNFGLTLPMTAITPVRGAEAHPFYAWVRDETGFAPMWNFNKVLIGPDGQVAGTWGSKTRPTAAQITDRIEALLPKG